MLEMLERSHARVGVERSRGRGRRTPGAFLQVWISNYLHAGIVHATRKFSDRATTFAPPRRDARGLN